MFVHLGGGHWTSLRKVVGIFNVAAVNGSTINQEYLRSCEGKNKDKSQDLDHASSLVVLDGEEVFCSPICSSTLTKRVSEMGKWLNGQGPRWGSWAAYPDAPLDKQAPPTKG